MRGGRRRGGRGRGRCGSSASRVRGRGAGGRPGAGAGLAAPAGARWPWTSTRRGGSRAPDEIVVSAGGSAWFDAVADVVRARSPSCRAGAEAAAVGGVRHRTTTATTASITPFNRVPGRGRAGAGVPPLGAGASPGPPGQAFLNAGKRDAAYDLGLPVPQVVRRATGPRARRPGVTGDRPRPTSTRGWTRPRREADLDGRRLGGAGAVASVHVLRQVAADPAGRGGRHGGTDYIRTFF